MNYLDFSRKIMLYLQLKGILFRFSVNTTTDMTALIENKDGKPFEFSVVESGKVDINAINGNAIIATVENIYESGKVVISAVNATVAMADVENIECKTAMLAEAVIGQALSTSFKVSGKSKVVITFEPYDSCPHSWSAEAQSSVEVLMEEADGIAARIECGEKTSADMNVTLAAAALVNIVITEKGTATFTAHSADALIHTFGVSGTSAMSATMKMMVDALIEDYDEVTLDEMNERTLEDLSKKIV